MRALAGWRTLGWVFGLAASVLGAAHAVEEDGLTVELGYLGEGLVNARQGQNGGKDAVYYGAAILDLSLDTEAANAWRGGEIGVTLLELHGDSLTEESVSDLQALSNIDGGEGVVLGNFHLAQTLWDGRLYLKGGWLDANCDFAGCLTTGGFLNSSAGFAPTVPMVTYPSPDWGLLGVVEITDSFGVGAGIYHGEGSAATDPGGAFMIVEPRYTFNLGGRPATVRAGGWYHTGRFERPDGAGDERGQTGWYLNGDLPLWRESGGEQGADAFFNVSATHGDRSLIEWFAAGGLTWLGPIPGRDADQLGVAVFHAGLSGDAGLPHGNETVYEAFYRCQTCDWLAATADTQFIDNPGGTGPDALVFGFRFEVTP